MTENTETDLIPEHTDVEAAEPVEPLDPASFDLDAWLEDAHLPEDSTRIFQKPNLVSHLSDLQRKIEDEQAAHDKDGTLAGGKRLREMKKEYERMLEQFGDSALTVYIRAVPASKIRELRRKIDNIVKARAEKENWSQEDISEFRANTLVYEIMAAAIVAVEPPGGPKKTADFTGKQVKKLEDRIGSGQFEELKRVKRSVEARIQEPDADFLHKSSSTSSPDTED